MVDYNRKRKALEILDLYIQQQCDDKNLENTDFKGDYRDLLFMQIYTDLIFKDIS